MPDTDVIDDWFDALGKPVSPDGIALATALLVDHGYDEKQAGMVLWVVAREVTHDQPDRAQKYLRSFVGSNETLVLRCLATMLAQVLGRTCPGCNVNPVDPDGPDGLCLDCSEAVADGAPPDALGYIVLTQTVGRWCDDWDGEVHPDREAGDAALAEAGRALGPDQCLLAVLHPAVDLRPLATGTATVEVGVDDLDDAEGWRTAIAEGRSEHTA